MDGRAISFRALYERYWPDLEPYLHGTPGLSCPLLISPPDNYAAQPVRLFVVGQETRSWFNSVMERIHGPAVIPALMEVYKDQFRLGLDRKRRSTFWEFVRALEGRLSIEPGAVVWSNINKIDEDGHRPCLQVRRDIRRLFPVLAEEVRLAAPEMVVFLTGRTYDRAVREHFFNGVQLVPDEQLGDLLMLVAHPQLPVRTFRTSHPRALRKCGDWARVLDRLETLALD